MKKLIKYLSILVILFLVLYLFWGPLFPWSPIKLGYTTIKTDCGLIFVNNKEKSNINILELKKIEKDEEKFHNLKYLKKFRVVVLTKESNMKRYLPWMKGKGFSVSLSGLNLIYVGPNAIRQNKIEEYLKHEMSHMLIGQNTLRENKMELHNQGWLVEGVAEYFSGHRFYNLEEFKYLLERNREEYKTIVEKNPLKIQKSELEFFFHTMVTLLKI